MIGDLAARIESLELLSAQLRDAEANLAAMLHNIRAEVVPYLQRTDVTLDGLGHSLSTQLQALQASFSSQNAAKWEALEELLLALFRIPASEAGPASAAAADDAEAASALDGVHAENNLH